MAWPIRVLFVNRRIRIRTYGGVGAGGGGPPLATRYLAGRLAEGSFPEEAEAMARSFLETGKDHPRLPRTLMLVARGLAHQGEPERARRYREVLQARFPDSEEAGEVRDTAGGQRPLDPPARSG